MHIKRIHEMEEKLTECALSQLNKGLEDVDTCEMGAVVDMIKDLADAEKNARISKSMEESTDIENLDTFDYYNDRRYYDNYRYKNSGRYAPKGKGTYVGRYGYEEPPYYHMSPERYRDMDSGRMYYTEVPKESNYDMAKRAYTETKGKNEETKVHELEKYINELSKDMSEFINDMTPSEKTMARAKLSALVSKI